MLRFHLFSLTHPPALDSLFQVLSLTLPLRRDRTLRPSLDKLASELAMMDSLSLPKIFEGIHVERVPDLSSRFNSRPSLWYCASVRDNRAFCSRNASISLFERSVLLFSRSLSFFRFARSFFNALVGFFLKRVSRSSHFYHMMDFFILASDIFWVLLKLDFRVFALENSRVLLFSHSFSRWCGGEKGSADIARNTLSVLIFTCAERHPPPPPPSQK